MAEKDLNALFVHQLKDTYFAENAILKALPQMAEAAQSKELKGALAVDQRPKRTHPPPVSKHLECLLFHENWWAPVQRRSALNRSPPQCQKQLISQSVRRTVRVVPLWTPIH